MTKERKLAIQMWQNIRGMLSASDGQIPESISDYKEMFCKDHDLQYSCWFCHYIQHCAKCPLHGCHSNSDYDTVISAWLNTDSRVKVCNNIIKALGGKANDR